MSEVEHPDRDRSINDASAPEQGTSVGQYEAGVNFARSLVERGQLSSGEFNGVQTIFNKLKSGIRPDEAKVIQYWVDRATWENTTNESSKKLDTVVLDKIGREALDSAESTSRSVDAALKHHLLENPQAAQTVNQLYRDFANNLYARLASANVRDPQRVEAALKLANALLEPEPTRDGTANAQAVIQLYRERLGQ